MRASRDSLNALAAAARGLPSIAENSPKMPPAAMSWKITSRPLET